jgi:hypothetical protein
VRIEAAEDITWEKGQIKHFGPTRPLPYCLVKRRERLVSLSSQALFHSSFEVRANVKSEPIFGLMMCGRYAAIRRLWQHVEILLLQINWPGWVGYRPFPYFLFGTSENGTAQATDPKKFMNVIPRRVRRQASNV